MALPAASPGIRNSVVFIACFEDSLVQNLSKEGDLV